MFFPLSIFIKVKLAYKTYKGKGAPIMKAVLKIEWIFESEQGVKEIECMNIEEAEQLRMQMIEKEKKGNEIEIKSNVKVPHFNMIALASVVRRKEGIWDESPTYYNYVVEEVSA